MPKITAKDVVKHMGVPGKAAGYNTNMRADDQLNELDAPMDTVDALAARAIGGQPMRSSTLGDVMADLTFPQADVTDGLRDRIQHTLGLSNDDLSDLGEQDGLYNAFEQTTEKGERFNLMDSKAMNRFIRIHSLRRPSIESTSSIRMRQARRGVKA